MDLKKLLLAAIAAGIIAVPVTAVYLVMTGEAYTPPVRASAAFYDGDIYVVYQDFQDFNSDLRLVTARDGAVKEKRTLYSALTDSLAPKVVAGNGSLAVFWLEYDYEKKTGSVMFSDLSNVKELVHGDLFWSLDAAAWQDGYIVAYIDRAAGEVRTLNVTAQGNVTSTDSYPGKGLQGVRLAVGDVPVILGRWHGGFTVYVSHERTIAVECTHRFFGLSMCQNDGVLAVAMDGNSTGDGSLVDVQFISLESGNRTVVEAGDRNATNEYPTVYWDEGWFVAFSSNLEYLDAEDPGDRKFTDIFIASLNDTSVGETKRCTDSGGWYDLYPIVVSSEPGSLMWYHHGQDYQLLAGNIDGLSITTTYELARTEGRAMDLLVPLAAGLLVLGAMAAVGFGLHRRSVPAAPQVDNMDKAGAEGGDSAIAERIRKKKEPLLKVSRDAGSYLFLRWFFIGLGAATTVWSMGPTMSEYAVLVNPAMRGFPLYPIAGTLVGISALVATVNLRGERRLSGLHSAGFWSCALGLAFSAGGAAAFLSLAFLQASAPVPLELAVHVLFFCSILFTGLGAALALAGATRDPTHIVTGGAFMMMGVVGIGCLPAYFEGTFFSNAYAAYRILTNTAVMPTMMGGLFPAILYPLILHDKLSFDLVKKPWEWTAGDFQRQRVSSLVMVTALAVLFWAVVLFMAYAMASEIFSWERIMLGLAGTGVGAMLIPMWKTKINRKAAEEEVPKSVSGYMNGVHLSALSSGIIGLMLAMVWGPLALIALVFFIWQIYYFDRFVRTELRDIVLRSKQISEELEEEQVATEREMAVLEEKQYPKEKLVRLAHKDERTMLMFNGGGMIVVAILWSTGIHHPALNSLGGPAADMVMLSVSALLFLYTILRGHRILKAGPAKKLLEGIAEVTSFWGVVAAGMYTFMLPANPVYLVGMLFFATIGMLYHHGYYMPALVSRMRALPGETVKLDKGWALRVEGLPDTEQSQSEMAADFDSAQKDG